MNYDLNERPKTEDITECTLEANLEKLDGFSKFKQNWNGYNADPIPRAVINKCREVLKQLKYQPKIFPTAACSIQIEYENYSTGDYLEFDFYEDHIEGFFMPSDNQSEEFTTPTADASAIINRWVEERLLK